MQSQYDEDYFLRGKETGKSLYENYRWLPDLTIPMARRMVEHLGIVHSDTILDFGCARGYLVRALVELGHNAFGYDVSQWALDNCDPSISDRLSAVMGESADWIIAKDVLEHLPSGDLASALERFSTTAKKGIFVVVPLSNDGRTYVVPEYEQDITHVQRMSLLDWAGLFHTVMDGAEWEIATRYRIAGIKDNYAQFARGNGFITCRRVT